MVVAVVGGVVGVLNLKNVDPATLICMFHTSHEVEPAGWVIFFPGSLQRLYPDVLRPTETALGWIVAGWM